MTNKIMCDRCGKQIENLEYDELKVVRSMRWLKSSFSIHFCEPCAKEFSTWCHGGLCNVEPSIDLNTKNLCTALHRIADILEKKDNNNED